MIFLLSMLTWLESFFVQTDCVGAVPALFEYITTPAPMPGTSFVQSEDEKSFSLLSNKANYHTQEFDYFDM